jgi:hypothetical protein
MSYWLYNSYMTTAAIDVDIRASGYENIYFDCPKCGKENILNRITDVGHTDAISRLEGLACRNAKCNQPISITGDRVTTAKYRWFIDDLFIQVARKEYRAYTLSLCQGLEAFFHQAIINKKFDRNPDYRDDEGQLIFEKYKAQCNIYEKKIKSWAYEKMRDEFLEVYADERTAYGPIGYPLKEDKRDTAFDTVKQSNINTMRNKVAHKVAYRPSYKDVEAYGPLIDAIYWLGAYLDVSDSVTILNKRLRV